MQLTCMKENLSPFCICSYMLKETMFVLLTLQNSILTKFIHLLETSSALFISSTVGNSASEHTIAYSRV